MVKLRDGISVILALFVLIATIVSSLSYITVVLAGGMVLVSLINAIPQVSSEQQQHVVPAVAILIMIVTLPYFNTDLVALSPIVGGVLGLIIVALKGSEQRWLAMAVFAIGLLAGAAVALITGRTMTALVILSIGVGGLVTAKYY